MAGSRVIEPDQFEVAVRGIIDGVTNGINQNLEQPVREACKAAKTDAKKNAPIKTGGYKRGFAYSVSMVGRYESVGYVGNRKKPGLVHLLEHGHLNVVTHRQTRAFPHMKPAAEVGEKVLEEECGKLVDRALQ